MRKLMIVTTVLLCSTLYSFGQELKVGLLFDQFASDRWKIDNKLLTDKFTELGVTCETKVAHSEAGVQVDQAKQFIRDGVDALVIIARDAEEAKVIVEFAKKTGVKVIAYDRLILDPRIDLCISYDNYEVGRMQARAAIAALPTGNYVLLNGPESDINAVQFRKGQLEVLNAYNTDKQIKIVKDIVLDSWHEMQTTMTLYDTNLNLEKVDCFMAAYDGISNGVIEYVGKGDDMKRIYLTGQDATPTAIENIKSDYQNMTILKPLKPLAETAALMTYQLIKGEKPSGVSKLNIENVEVNGKLFNPVLIDKSNFDTNEALLEQIEIASSIE